MLEKQEVNLQESYELSSELVRKYSADGHVCVRGLATPEEVAHYGAAIRSTVYRMHKSSLPLHARDTYGKAFIQVTNLWENDEMVRRFVLARKFAHVAAQLMGVKGVRLYHDQALFKEPGGGHTPWHQDQVYWPIDSPNTVTMWMPLVPVSEEMGSMTFASGSHEIGYINKMVISDESHRTLQQYIDGKGFERVTHGAMVAGDATFHAGWTLHSAPGNPTDRMREIMTIIYVADGERVGQADSNARKGDLASWFPGLSTGDLIQTDKNPLVYQE